MTVKPVLINIGCALFVPFILQAIVIVVGVALGPGTPGYSNFSSQIVNALVGFVFLVRAFRIYAIAVGFAYLPAMAYALVGFTLAFNGVVYGNWL